MILLINAELFIDLIQRSNLIACVLDEHEYFQTISQGMPAFVALLKPALCLNKRSSKFPEYPT